jgi:hypothetical protein
MGLKTLKLFAAPIVGFSLVSGMAAGGVTAVGSAHGFASSAGLAAVGGTAVALAVPVAVGATAIGAFGALVTKDP